MAWWRADADGLLLFVRLTPRGGRDAIDGPRRLSDGREVLAIRVRAAPESGAANTALIALVAKAFGTAKAAVTLAGGATSRVKQLKITGDAKTLAVIAARHAPSSSI